MYLNISSGFIFINGKLFSAISYKFNSSYQRQNLVFCNIIFLIVVVKGY